MLEAARAYAGMAGDDMFSFDAPATTDALSMTGTHSIETPVDVDPGKDSDLKNQSQSDADDDSQDPLPLNLLSREAPNVTDDKESQASEDQQAHLSNVASSRAVDIKSVQDLSLL